MCPQHPQLCVQNDDGGRARERDKATRPRRAPRAAETLVSIPRTPRLPPPGAVASPHTIGG